MILEFSWLKKHNPEIDFCAGTIKMTRCLPHCCVRCKDEQKAERDTKKEVQQVNVCRTGPFPAFFEDTEDELEPEAPLEEEFETPLDDDDELLEEGDCTFDTSTPFSPRIPSTNYLR